MKKIKLIITILLICFLHAPAQKIRFDIASFTVPQGWQRIDSNGVVAFMDSKTVNGLTSFCQIFLYPSRAANGNAVRDFNLEWQNRVALPAKTNKKPKPETILSPEGWTVTTGYANISQLGITYTCMLVTASGFGKVMTVRVNMAGSGYAEIIRKFFEDLDLDGNSGSVPGASQVKDSVSNQKIMMGTVTLNDYEFIVPERWIMQKAKDHILLSQSQTTEHGCIIQIIAPQPSSGDLEKDARAVFDQMYPGWQYRFTGEKHDDMMKGYTLQGLEYCMIDAPMHKMRPDGYYYDYEDGSALVIKFGNQIAIIAGRHNRLIACFCYHQYEYWRRFFNSFTVKGQTASKNTEDVSKRIVGDWMAMGGMALTEYIFAANGNYQFIGAYGTTTKTSDYHYDYIHIKTSAFKGDGSYFIKGNQLSFTTNKDQSAEQLRFRFEKVNHGSTGWKDRLYMLKKDGTDGKEYEVCYEKREGVFN